MRRDVPFERGIRTDTQKYWSRRMAISKNGARCLDPYKVSRLVCEYCIWTTQMDDLTCKTDDDLFFGGNQSDKDRRRAATLG